ncbi:MAG TPA: PDZ domain-containing protein [Bryobacteraceae bacterium]|nr:PDZ domain-containing protein [Bryobacteraceae bacterium]
MKVFPICVVIATLLMGGNLAAGYQPEPPDPSAPPEEVQGDFFPGLHPASRSFLGIGVTEIDSDRARSLKLDEERGVEVTKVVPDSPAAKAGMKTGDIVLEYNGQKVVGTEQFVRLVRETPIGRNVRLLLSRDGKTQTLTATTASRKQQQARVFAMPPGKDWARLGEEMESLNELQFRMPDIPKAYMSWRTSVLGVEAESLEAQLADYFGVKEGVLVRSVLKDSPAEKAGLKAGDIIIRVSETKVTTPRDVSSAIRSARSQKTFPITVVRNRKEMTLTVTLEDSRSGQDHHREFRVIRNTELNESRL